MLHKNVILKDHLQENIMIIFQYKVIIIVLYVIINYLKPNKNLNQVVDGHPSLMESKSPFREKLSFFQFFSWQIVVVFVGLRAALVLVLKVNL